MIKQFLLSACLVLITGSFLLLWDSPPESFLRPDASKIETLPSADSYMSNINAYIFSPDGTQKYVLKASKISVFRGLSELKLTQPLLTAYKTDILGAQFQIKAENATLFKAAQIFEFDGNVNANWENLAGKTVLKAEQLSYSLGEDSASAEGGVELLAPDSKISGDSLTANFDTKILKIESRVRGVHDSI